ncbi:ATP-grasp domain-containing protein [Embleya sp. NPDC050493]|uniref:ATP-grasp domain-containing protein n=1 Tax=Embleya sp. NPDC050493 TaxID=3363989 RepID=UPI0037A1911F
MTSADRVLLVAPRSTDTDRALVGAVLRRGLPARRLHTWRVPEDLVGARAHPYAGPLFADAVARDLDPGLLGVAPIDECAQGADALAFGADVPVAAGSRLPSAIVVDVGTTDRGWAVVEANAAWASGAHASDIDAVPDVVLRAGGPRGEHRECDTSFPRHAPVVRHRA